MCLNLIIQNGEQNIRTVTSFTTAISYLRYFSSQYFQSILIEIQTMDEFCYNDKDEIKIII